MAAQKAMRYIEKGQPVGNCAGVVKARKVEGDKRRRQEELEDFVEMHDG